MPNRGISGDLLLLMDNCGGHEHSIRLLGLRIEFLPPRTTTKYESLNLGLFVSGKIRFRGIL